MTVTALGLLLVAGCVVGPPVRVVTVYPGTTLPASLIRKARHGDPVAQFTLGSCYANGRGVPRNYPEAVKWYYLAARQGCAPAQNRLGVCYYQGLGTPQNYTAAAIWYRQAARQGNAPAEDNLGMCYFNGHGVARNLAEARKWCRLAAEQGNPAAQNHLLAFANGGAAATPGASVQPAPNPPTTPAAAPEEPASGNQMTVDEIKELGSAGVKADTLTEQIKSTNSKFSPQDVAAAQQANIDPTVIECMKENPR
jgi:TPR repeat protein